MTNDHIPRPAAEFHAWQTIFVACAKAHLADMGLAVGVMESDIRARLTWAPRRRLRSTPVGYSGKRIVEKKRVQEQVDAPVRLVTRQQLLRTKHD